MSSDSSAASSMPVGYQVAGLKNRLLAYLIDWAIMIGISLTIWPIVLTHLKPFSPEELLVFSLMITIVFYNLLFEIGMNGQTPGKIARHIRVVRPDGSGPRLGNHLRRWLIQPVGVLSIGALFLGFATNSLELTSVVGIGMVLLLAILKIGKGQRLGNRLTGAVFVNDKVIVEAVVEPRGEDKPEAPASLIANIAEASKNARSIYLLFVGVLAYCALTVASTSDRRIILNEPARLPVINLEVSLDGFFILAPILSIFMFVYFQLYLHKLKRLFNDLRIHFRPIEEEREIYPWMLNFASELGSGFVARTQRFIVTFSLWWSLPTVLMLLALWYLKKHHPLLSGTVGIMPLVGTLIVLAFWSYYEQPAARSAKWTAAMRTLLAIVLLFEIYLFGMFMPRALRGERIIRTWPAVDLSDQNLVDKQGERVYWVNLRGARLQGADFTGAILEKADLRQANLEVQNLKKQTCMTQTFLMPICGARTYAELC